MRLRFVFRLGGARCRLHLDAAIVLFWFELLFRELVRSQKVLGFQPKAPIEHSHVDSHRVIDASAISNVVADPEPVIQGKIDSLGNVKAKIEPRVVGCSSGYHELILLVEALHHFDPVVNENFRIH